MPPKAKFSKKEIIEAAVDIVKAEGSQALTARALGASSAHRLVLFLRYFKIWTKCSKKF